ncbi:hypothetical protein FKW77_006346 [Venturia effusa]|uniref:Uncharacterized protein n=1 Tax=Venturia effusa TaxID=50376 RepID=A0A517LJ17_9PEZI|nr:hypothetical protein FKW77_006346 [Venturia effusa]
MMLRYGTALAYVTKASLVAAIIFGLKQQIWATFRRKNIQVSTIDSLFASVDDPHALLNLEMATKAKTAFALAVLIWIFPLLVILTPATLTVAQQTESVNTTCESVRTLNFDLERTRNWRNGHKINGLYESSPALWNCTLPMSGTVSDPYNATFFDYYTAPAPGMQRLVTLSVLQKRVIEMENVNALVCGNGWNCTYDITFEGPGYKCDEVARGIGDNRDSLARMNAPFNTGVLIPEGNFSYIAHTSLGEYAAIQMDVEPGGVPKEPAPYPPHLGAFRTEPVVWIGFADINDRSAPLPINNDNSTWSEFFTPRVIKCEHYVTRYTVQFKQTLGTQQTILKNRTYVRRLIDTDFVPGVDALDGTMDNVTATPKSNYILPLDVENYRFTAAYHAIGQLVRPYVNGTITNNPTNLPMQASDAVLTGLIDPRNFFVVENFMQQFQSFYEDVIWSIFSNPSFYHVSWARAPDQPSGTLNATSDNMLWPCTKTRVINKFVYRRRELWIAYTFAIVLAMAGVSLGAAAIAQNNHHPRDTRFSSIVAATRGTVLDEMPWKRSRWGEVPREVFKQKLEYGVIADGALEEQSQSLQSRDRENYFGFAPEGKVRSGLGSQGRGRLSALSFRSLEQQ